MVSVILLMDINGNGVNAIAKESSDNTPPRGATWVILRGYRKAILEMPYGSGFGPLTPEHG